MKQVLGGIFTRSVSIGSVDAEARTAELTWSTGARVRTFDWDEGVVNEELSMAPESIRMGRLTSGRAPLLDNHVASSENVIGVVASAYVAGGQGHAKVRFASEGVDENADKIFRKVKDGILPNVSVGYRVYKYEKTKTDGEIPLLRAVDWEPFELSIVPVGADANAFVRSESENNPIEIVSQSESAENGDDEVKIENKAESKDATVVAERALVNQDEIVKAERARVRGIHDAVKTAGLGTDHAEKWIDAGTSLDEVRKLALDAIAERTAKHQVDTHRVEVTDDSHDKYMRAASASLIDRMVDVKNNVVEAKKRGHELFQDVDFTGLNEFRGMRLIDFARAALERQNIKTRGMDREEILSKALTLRSGPYGSTSDFPVLLENVLNKSLLSAYAVVNDLWSNFCKPISMSDFRDSNFYRTGSFGVLDVVAENGEYKNKAIPDGAKTTVSLQSYGNIIAISRKALINDDISGIANTIAGFGRAAKLTIEKAFFTMLALNSGAGPTMSDSNPFFHSSRGNTTSAAAISVAAIDADRKLMLAQQDPSSNEYLNLYPDRLLVNLTDSTSAKIINTSAYDHDSTKLQKPNPMQNLFSFIGETPRVASTKRYMFANPNNVAAFVVAFLDGNQEPRMQTQEGWRVDGTEMKISLDFQVNAFDPKGAVYNAGA